ncbi:MAG: DUF2752 domain-containing protein [Planctomycetaceae bacterium]|nr:DUF2752 domain-containing protein [Planctomycetales bacterium]MCB9923236.1 DUF2752 domain-containing protein [Planctomycetaceae bacterium]
MQLSPSNLNERVMAKSGDGERLYDRPDTTFHWVLLGISSVVVLLAVLMQVRGDEQVILPGVDLPLPGTCTFKQFVGADCPGCGLTRCFVSMGHGQIRRAWHFNPVGIFFFAVVASQIPFRSVQLWRLKSGANEICLGWWGYSMMLIVLGALLIQWILRMIVTFT